MEGVDHMFSGYATPFIFAESVLKTPNWECDTKILECIVHNEKYGDYFSLIPSELWCYSAHTLQQNLEYQWMVLREPLRMYTYFEMTSKLF